AQGSVQGGGAHGLRRPYRKPAGNRTGGRGGDAAPDLPPDEHEPAGGDAPARRGSQRARGVGERDYRGHYAGGLRLGRDRLGGERDDRDGGGGQADRANFFAEGQARIGNRATRRAGFGARQ